MKPGIVYMMRGGGGVYNETWDRVYDERGRRGLQ